MAIAAIAPNWLGDLVMAVPALRGLAEKSDGGLDVFALEPLAPLVRELLPAREVIGYQKARGLGRVRLKTQLARLLQRGSYESAVLLPNSFRSALAAWRAGIPQRIGTAMHGRSFLLTQTVGAMAEAEHQMDAYLRIAEAAIGSSIEVASDEATIVVSEELKARARQILKEQGVDVSERKFAVLAPGAAYGPAKQWGATNFGLAAKMLADERIVSVIAGTKTDSVEAGRIAQATGGARVVDITGRTSLVELAGVISLAAGFIGNDSGAAHLAAAIGVPTVALFLSTEPVHTAQRGPKVKIVAADISCRPCMDRTCSKLNYECRGAIEPARVVDALVP